MQLHHTLAHTLHVHPNTWTLVMLICCCFYGVQRILVRYSVLLT
jgi:hypothetical protein